MSDMSDPREASYARRADRHDIDDPRLASDPREAIDATGDRDGALRAATGARRLPGDPREPVDAAGYPERSRDVVDSLDARMRCIAEEQIGILLRNVIRPLEARVRELDGKQAP